MYTMHFIVKLGMEKRIALLDGWEGGRVGRQGGKV